MSARDLQRERLKRMRRRLARMEAKAEHAADNVRAEHERIDRRAARARVLYEHERSRLEREIVAAHEALPPKKVRESKPRVPKPAAQPRARGLPVPPAPRPLPPVIAWLVFKLDKGEFAAVPRREGERASMIRARAASRGWPGGREYARRPAGIPEIIL